MDCPAGDREQVRVCAPLIRESFSSLSLASGGPWSTGSRESSHSPRGHRGQATAHGVMRAGQQPTGSRESGHGPQGPWSWASRWGCRVHRDRGAQLVSEEARKGSWWAGEGDRAGGMAEGLGWRPRTRSAGPRLRCRGRGLGLKGPADSPQVCPGEPRTAGGTEWPWLSLRAHARPHGHSWAAAVCG